MISLGDIVIGYILILLGWYMWQAQKSREQAREMASSYCKQLELQLLDDTVVLSRIRFKKSQPGRIKISRTYQFEFSSMGNERYHGSLELLGNQMVDISLDAHRV